MKSKDYHFFYDSLHTFEDVKALSKKHRVSCGILACILNQKVVADVKRKHHHVKNHEGDIVKEWKNKKTFLEISQRYRYPPTLISTLILQNIGCKKKEIARYYKETQGISDPRLQKELTESLNADYFFSPKAHELQKEKGKIGENIISLWLKKKGWDYADEDELRAAGHDEKTPDFLLKKPICLDDAGNEVYESTACDAVNDSADDDGEDADIDDSEMSKIYWIESKALFGEVKEHKNYEKNQYLEYSKRYGPGLVVYWYGFETDILRGKKTGYFITDFSFFKKDFPNQVNRFLNFMVYW